MRFVSLLCFACAFFLGCGSEEGGTNAASDQLPSNEEDSSEEGSNPTFGVVVAGSKPDCTEANEGALVFVKSDGFYHCQSAKWKEIDLKGDKGEQGEQGEKGETGETGEAGQDGNDNRIVYSRFCSGTLSGTSVYVHYGFSRTTVGDMFVSGGVTIGDASVDSAKYYSKDQNGATAGELIVQLDLEGADNFGFWSIESKETLGATVTYDDVGESSHGAEWDLSCTENSYE